MRMASIGLLILLISPVLAQDEGKVIKETWDLLYLGGARAGYAHTRQSEVQRDGKPMFLATLETNLRIRRFNQVVEMGLVQKSEETSEGKVRLLGMTTKLDKGKEASQVGRVEGDSLLVQIDNQKTPRKMPWSDDVIGLIAQDRLWVGKKIQPGMEVRFKNYDPLIASAVSLTAKVKQREDTLVLEDKGTPEKPKGEQVRKPLWRVEVVAEPVLVMGQRITLPGQTIWVDDEGRTLRSESEIPGLGRMTTLRASKGLALANDAAPAEMPDLGLNTLVKLAKPIPKAHEASKIVYRITVQGDPMPNRAFASDARQKNGEPRVDLFEMTVQAVREPGKLSDLPAPADPDFLKSTQYLDSADERIKQLATRVTAGETDPLAKARKLERWVHENMKPTSAIGLMKASQVCAELRGDCRQHGMLLAALCRASGVPARTAQGLVYVDDPKQGPFFGFHLWTEVWIKGQWIGLDATLGKGSIGAAHLKINDSSWKDGEGLAPLLSLIQVLGRLQIEVASVE